jgi:steroid delta-isomerase-like uncharacterized protein
MTLEANKAVVRRFIEEVINQGRVDLVDILFAPKMREKVKGFLAVGADDPFPDGREEIQAMVAEGNTVVAHWILRGTHLAPFHGIPATGKSIEAHGFSIYFLENGQIVDDLMIFDDYDVLEQIGAKIVPPNEVAGTTG